MNKKKISIIWKCVIAFLVTFTSFTAFIADQTINATETFDINQTVTTSEDGKSAVITFDVVSVNELYTVNSIKNPDGTQMDLSNAVYSVSENGTYTFDVEYQDTLGVKSTTSKEVIVDEINTQNEVSTAIIPAKSGVYAGVTDGGVAINIPEYDAVGWENGAIKEVNITANFGDDSTGGKRLEITIPEGMRIEAVSINDKVDRDGLDPNILAVYGPSELISTAILAMSVPKKEEPEMGATFGQITYDFSSGTREVTIVLKVSVDKARYYGVHTIPKPIKAYAKKGDIGTIQVGEANMVVHGSGKPVIKPILIRAGLPGTGKLMISKVGKISEGVTDVNRIDTHAGSEGGAIKDLYAKNIELKAYYPESTKFKEYNAPGLSLAEENTTDNYLKLQSGEWQKYVNYKIYYELPIGVGVGVYSNKGPDEVVFTWYDGKKNNINVGNGYEVKSS